MNGKTLDFIRTILIFAGVAALGYGIFTLTIFGMDPMIEQGGTVMSAGIGITAGAIAFLVLVYKFVR